jgi:hypothetical protein
MLGNVEAVQHGYRRGGISGGAEGLIEREVRRSIYRNGNRMIAQGVRAIGLAPSHRRR